MPKQYDYRSQFTSELWTEYLEKSEIKISMDGKGRAIDNIFIERLWRSVKYDYVFLNPAVDGNDLFYGLREYFDYYNHCQAHQGIGRRILQFKVLCRIGLYGGNFRYWFVMEDGVKCSRRLQFKKAKSETSLSMGI